MADNDYKYPGAVGCVKVLWILTAVGLVVALIAGQTGRDGLGAVLLFGAIGLVSGVAGLVGLIGIGISRAFRK